MTRRYGDYPTAGTEAAPTTATADTLHPAAVADRLVLSSEPDGLWALRWTERATAPRPVLRPDQTDPLDEAYRHALHLREESGSAHVSYVGVTLSGPPHPALTSSTTSSRDVPTQTYMVELRCLDADLLTTWAAERLGVTAWDELDPSTRVEAGDSPTA